MTENPYILPIRAGGWIIYSNLTRPAGGNGTSKAPFSLARLIAVETLIGTAINASVPPAIIRLSGLAPPSVLFGVPGLALGMAMATALPVFFMCLFLSLSVRQRIRSGRIVVTDEASIGGRAIGMLPRNAVARAAVFAVASLCTIYPASLAVVAWMNPLPMTLNPFTLFNVAYGAFVGVTVTPLIVYAAVADSEAPPTRDR